MKPVFLGWLGAALLLPGVCLSQGDPLSLSEALRLARERAATVIAAEGRVEEARVRLVPAARRLRENPVLELTGGRRQVGETFADFEATIRQGLEPAARRRARIAGADADLESARAGLAEVRRIYLGEVSAAFQRTLAAQEAARLAAQADTLAGDLLATAERRYQAGETTALELNRVRIAAARSRAERSAAEAGRLSAGGGLRALLGLEPGKALTVSGSPRDLPVFSLEPLLAGVAERPDLQALAAAVRQAEAEVQLGETLARPDFALRTGYKREERADVVSAGISVALPWFQRGQEEQSVGRVRAASLRSQLEVARRSAETEVRTAFEAYQHRIQAIEELEKTAIPAVDDNETLAQRSFEAGEINLGELLLIRQEILEARHSYLNLLLEAGLAAAELETRAGAYR